MKIKYMTNEAKTLYALLMVSAGMMGAYTFNLRGGVFSNAQTANVVMMAIAFGKGEVTKALYYLIPISAYFLGAFISELFILPSKKIGLLKWDTYLIAFEAIVLFGIGFIPLTWSHHIVQVIINFIASMQYNTFRKAREIPMATTFCTNHVRQIGIQMAKVIRNKDITKLKICGVHILMIISFLFGGIVLTYSCKYLQERSIWLAIIPMTFCFFNLMITDIEDNKKEKKQQAMAQ